MNKLDFRNLRNISSFRILRHLTVLGLILTVLGLFPGFLKAQESPESLRAAIDQKAKELEEVNKQIEQNQQNLGAVQGYGKTLKNEIDRISGNINQVALGIKSSEIKIDKYSLEIASLQNSIDLQERTINSKKETVTKVLQDFQKKDDESVLLTLLNNESLADSISEVQALTDLNNQLLLEVEKIRELKNALSNHLGEVSEKKTGLEVEKGSLEVKKEVAEEQKQERSQLLVQTKNEEAVYKQVLSALEQRQQAISAEIEKIEDQLRASVDDTALPSKRSGVLAYPVDNPYLTQGYGATPDAARLYKSGFHNGIDLRARPAGTAIYAADDGVILEVGDNGNVQYGKYVLIKHDNNLATLYAHLSRHGVSRGESVKRGQVIGYSGNTGYSFAVHLHFVVYSAPTVILQSFPGAGLVPVGKTLNPLDYL